MVPQPLSDIPAHDAPERGGVSGAAANDNVATSPSKAAASSVSDRVPMSLSVLVRGAFGDMLSGILTSPIDTAERVRRLRANTRQGVLEAANDNAASAAIQSPAAQAPSEASSGVPDSASGSAPGILSGPNYSMLFPQPAPLDPLDEAFDPPAANDDPPPIVRIRA